jgi:hypothetical protein
MTTYNLMTMAGFTEPGSSFSITWIASWIGLLVTFYLAFILRKQCSDGFLAGTNYNWIAALIIGLVANIIIVTFSGQPAWALLGGVGGIALGGFVVGMIAPTEGSEGGEDYG